MEADRSSWASSPRRKRGRPRHNEEQAQESVKARREKNREAQRLLKARRSAKWTDKEKHIYQLESVIENMGDVVLTLADNVMSSSLARRDAHLVRKLQESISQTLGMIRDKSSPEFLQDCVGHATASSGFVPNNTQNAPCCVPPPPSSELGKSADLQTLLISPTTVRLDGRIQGTKSPNSAVELALEWSSYKYAGTATFRTNAQRPSSEWMLDLMSPLVLSRSINPTTSLERHAIGFNIVYSTLRFADYLLRNTPDLSTGLAARIFSYSLKVFSREELLAKLAWSLGPGLSNIPVLVACNVDYLLDSYPSETSPARSASDFDPGEGAQDFCMAGSAAHRGLVNAKDIVEWLASMGVRRIDQDTLELSMEDSTAVGYLQERHSFFDAAVLFPPTTPEAPPHKRLPTRSVQISESGLMRRLPRASVCLRSGLAYRRHHLAEIILASHVV